MDSEATVGDVITREYVGVSESDDVRGTVQLMRQEQASSVLVLRGDEPVGIVTEWDVLGLVADDDDPDETPVSEVMSSPVESVEADAPLTDAAGLMSGEGIRNLLVVDGATGETLGVLTDRDIIAAVASLQRTRSRPGVGSPAETARSPTDPDAVPSPSPETTGGVTNEAEVKTTTYVSQGVCELCGSLSETLYDTNGQLVCPDCREV